MTGVGGVATGGGSVGPGSDAVFSRTEKGDLLCYLAGPSQP